MGDSSHTWVGAATVSLSEAQAKTALLRHCVWLPEQAKVHILEVYCSGCRRVWDDVADQPCVAVVDNEHLRGGPIGERKKRRHDLHNCEAAGCDVSQAVNE